MKNKKNYRTAGTLFAVLAFILLMPIGCSKDEDPTENNTNPTCDQNVNEYLVNLTSWNEFCPHKADEDLAGDLTQAFYCNDNLVETTTPCSITRTPEEIVTCDPGSSILYVGSLIQGDGYTGGLGSIQSLPIYQRAPITVTIDVSMPDNSRLVENPGLATVSQAVGELILSAENSGQQTGSNISFKTRTCHSVEQLALSLGLSFKKLSTSASLDLAWEHEKEKNTVSAFFIQKMFTISMAIPQRPGDFFSADFTQDILDEQISLGRIGPDNLPVYVSNIVYGRMMLFTMTSTHQADSMGAALKGRYGAINGSIHADYQKIIENSTFTLTTIGGDAQDALDFISSGEYGAFFQENPPLTTAVPISYTLRSLGDNSVATVSETTAYDMVQYERINLTLYDDEGDWKSAQSEIENYKWECNLSNVKKANEADEFLNGPNSDEQWYLYKKITFDESAIEHPFSFSLENMDGDVTPNNEYGLVFNENGSKNWGNYISIGDVNDYEDDDFEIRITSGNVYAIAFIMEENGEYDDEYLKVYADDGSVDGCEIGSFAASEGHKIKDGFWGIVSPVPLNRIYFNEDAGSDDIAIGDLYFGYRED